MTDDVFKRCVEMYEAGYYPQQIVAQTEFSPTEVRNAIARARRIGAITPHRNSRQQSLRFFVEKYHIKIGTVGAIGHALSPDQRQWLVNETARLGCSSVAEYLLEVVRDLHAEAVSASGQADGTSPGFDRGGAPSADA